MQGLKDLLQLTRDNIDQGIVDYLRTRGVKKSSADLWQIGFLPDQALLQQIEDKESLRKAGVLIKGHTAGQDFSPLHQYITFPLYNQYGELIGLSGRTLLKGKVKRKYWHSIINKRRFLFGLDKAIPYIREKGYAIVSEGQFDIITSHQGGIKNIVGTMGTALTPDQVTLLSRYTKIIYVIFDGDSAGQRASETQVDRNTREGVTIIPIHLPEGEDVDSYVRKYSPEALLSLIHSEKATAEIDL